MVSAMENGITIKEHGTESPHNGMPHSIIQHHDPIFPLHTHTGSSSIEQVYPMKILGGDQAEKHVWQNVTELRQSVWNTRIDLNSQRGKYVEGRDNYDAAANSLMKAFNSAMNQTLSNGIHEKLCKRHKKLMITAKALTDQENITKGLEIKLSNLERRLHEQETALQGLIESKPGPWMRDMSNQDTESDVSAQSSLATQETLSDQSQRSEPSAVILIRKRHRQLVKELDNLQERLEVLDFDCQHELDVYEWRDSQGLELSRSQNEILQEYESDRKDIVEQLANADIVMKELCDEANQHGLLLEPDDQIFSPSASILKNETLRLFPGTYNGALGIGLKEDQITTGSISFNERIENWFRSQSVEAMDLNLVGKTLKYPSSVLNDATTLKRISARAAMGHQSDATVSAEIGGSKTKENAMLIWRGDAPKRRYSAPTLSEKTLFKDFW